MTGTKAVIGIIDRRVLIRDCLIRSLGQLSEFAVIGAISIDEWLERSPHRDVAVILLSLSGCLASEENRAEIRRLSAACAEPVIVLSERETLGEIVNVFAEGAKGYIPTSLDLDMALDALWLVKSGGVYLPRSSLSSAQLTHNSQETSASPLDLLFTDRQRAVLEGLRLGKANKIIAHELKMREGTVKVHIRNIMKKLSATNRTEVAYKANEILRNPGILRQSLHEPSKTTFHTTKVLPLKSAIAH